MNEVGLHVEGEETMSCCLTKETHQPCLKCERSSSDSPRIDHNFVGSETAELEAGEQFREDSQRG